MVVGSSRTAHWSASDATSGLASAASGSVALTTSTPGVHSVDAPAATDNAGNTSTAVSCSYLVQFNLLGFFSPASTSKWKRGSTVPVKVALANAGRREVDGSADDRRRPKREPTGPAEDARIAPTAGAVGFP